MRLRHLTEGAHDINAQRSPQNNHFILVHAGSLTRLRRELPPGGSLSYIHPLLFWAFRLPQCYQSNNKLFDSKRLLRKSQQPFVFGITLMRFPQQLLLLRIPRLPQMQALRQALQQVLQPREQSLKYLHRRER